MTTPAGTEKALLLRKSVLDFVREDVDTFQGRLGGTEKAKFDFYLDSLRTLEREIGGGVPAPADIRPQRPVRQDPGAAGMLSTNTQVNDMPTVNKLYLDTIAMGFACGVTRVASLHVGRRPVRRAGVVQGHRHGQLALLVARQPQGGRGPEDDQDAGLHGRAVHLLRPEAEELRRRGLLAAGQHRGGAEHPERHQHPGGSSPSWTTPSSTRPFVVAGGGAGAWKTGRVIDCNDRTHNDVYLSIAQAFGMKVNTVGDPGLVQGPACRASRADRPAD